MIKSSKLRNGAPHKVWQPNLLFLIGIFMIIGCGTFNQSQSSSNDTSKSTAPTAPIGSPANPTGEKQSATKDVKTSSPLQVLDVSQVLELYPNITTTHKINDKFISFNTGFLFTAPIEDEPEIKTITQTLKPNALRFPGGTIANFYHPDGVGYGLRESETKGRLAEIVKAMPLFKDNAIYHFAKICKMSNSDVVFAANILTGTIDEAVWVLDYFKKQNIKVIGIELGNELYFKQYSDVFPDVQAYIKKAKEFAKVLKQKYPEIPLGAVAGDPTGPNPKGNNEKVMNIWNAAVGKETFYDFYIPHLYSKTQVCQNMGGNDLQKIFDCVNIALAPEHYNYTQIVLDHYKAFYGNKKMWITEWNSEAASYVSNSVRQAGFVGEFLMNLVDASIKNPEVEYAFFHNYGSGGYVSPIFSYTNDTKIKFYKKVGHIAYNTAYFPFLYLRQLISQGAERADETITYPSGMDNQQVVTKTFVSNDKSKLFVFFVNKTTQNIQLNIKGINSLQQTDVQGIMGDFPWSMAGWNGLNHDLPQNVNLIKQIPTTQKDIPANSVGYFEYRIK
ncbi:MAG: hypothetical protein M9887_11930 [Chitinophagales bacterium]|nr:hypothetical protein [Chitinophagales bacterium]